MRLYVSSMHQNQQIIYNGHNTEWRILIETRKNHTDQKSRVQYINNINSIKYLHSFSELSFHVHTPYFLFKMNKNVMKNYFPYSWNSFIYLYNINSRNLMKESSCKNYKIYAKNACFLSRKCGLFLHTVYFSVNT